MEDIFVDTSSKTYVYSKLSTNDIKIIGQPCASKREQKYISFKELKDGGLQDILQCY